MSVSLAGAGTSSRSSGCVLHAKGRLETGRPHLCVDVKSLTDHASLSEDVFLITLGWSQAFLWLESNVPLNQGI